MTDEDEFLSKLQCEADAGVKVVCIVGKAGSGKSFTLNHTLFDGCEVFSTKSSESPCGSGGVWAAHDEVHEAVVLDTEGWLGNSYSQRQHVRLLLKVYVYTFEVIFAYFYCRQCYMMYIMYSRRSLFNVTRCSLRYSTYRNAH